MRRARLLKFIYIPLLLCFSLFRFFSILGADRIGPVYDSLSLRHLSRILYDVVSGRAGSLSLFFEHLHSSAYPSFVHFTALPFMAVFGMEKGAEYSLSLYLVILLLSIWAIANKLAGERAALIALLFSVFTPLLDTFARVYTVDYPLAAIVSMIIYLLLESEGFSRRKPAILLGVAVCVGLLIKQTLIVYVGIPIVVSILVHIFKSENPDRKERIKNFTIFSFLAVFIPIVWHAPGFFELLAQSGDVSDSNAGLEPEKNAVIGYFWLLVRSGLGPVLALGAGYGLVKTVRLKKFRTLWLWGMPPLFLIGLFYGFESARYLLPILPAFVILFAIALNITCERLPLRFAWMAIILIAIIVAAAFWVTLGIPTGESFTFEDFNKRFNEKGLVHPDRLDWNVADPAKRILSATNHGKIIFLLNSPYSERLRGVLWDEQPLLAVDTLIERTSIGWIPKEIKNAEAISDYLDPAGWILLHSKYKDGYQYINYSNPLNAKAILPVFERFFKIVDQFELVGKYDYPNGGGYALLYKRTD